MRSNYGRKHIFISYIMEFRSGSEPLRATWPFLKRERDNEHLVWDERTFFFNGNLYREHVHYWSYVTLYVYRGTLVSILSLDSTLQIYLKYSPFLTNCFNIYNLMRSDGRKIFCLLILNIVIFITLSLSIVLSKTTIYISEECAFLHYPRDKRSKVFFYWICIIWN